MSFEYSIYNYKTNHRPTNNYSHYNEDIHCDNEVNLILETKRKQSSIQKPTKTLVSKDDSSVSDNQVNPYYFVPIREQALTAAVAENHVIDCLSASLLDLHHHPSISNLLDESSSANYFPTYTSTMNSSSDTTTVNPSNQTNYILNDTDLAAPFASSLFISTPPPIAMPSSKSFDTVVHKDAGIKDDKESSSSTFEDVFSNQVTDLGFEPSSPFIDSQSTIGPPPGFESFHFDLNFTTNGLPLSKAINNPASLPSTNAVADTAVSNSDTINFSQLIPSTEVDFTQLQHAPIAGGVGYNRSSSSSHPSFASDEQSIFFPTKNHPYSPSTSILHASSQIFSNTTPSSTSTTNATNPVANPQLPNSLSFSNPHIGQVSSSSSSSLSRMPTSANDSPLPKTNFDTDIKSIDGDLTQNRIFTSTNSFFSNGHADLNSPNKQNRLRTNVNSSSSIPARTSSSSSSTSSNDDALNHLAQNQQKRVQMNKFFNDDAHSIFNFNGLSVDQNIDKEQQQAVHDNISFLASMATASTPVTSDTPWSLSDGLHQTNSNPLDLNKSLQRKQTNNHYLRRQLSHQPSTRTQPTNLTLRDLIEYLNESCYRGFDELHTLIQEQRCVQSTLNIASTSMTSGASPVVTLNGVNYGSSRVLVVPEYFIFKCKKVEATACHVFEILLKNCPEYRLRDRLGAFKSWKEAILNAESIHQEEENKLRLSTEHPNSYYMTESVLQSTFDRVCSSIRLLTTLTHQIGEIFQMIVINATQQPPRQSLSESNSNGPQTPGSMTAQTKSSFFFRNLNGSIRSTP